MAFARSATHSIHDIASGLLHHHRSTTEDKIQVSAQTHDQEKAFVAQFIGGQQHPLAPEEVQQDPRNKDLGRSSRGLTVKDFELVRTLGTGSCSSPLYPTHGWSMSDRTGH